MTLTDRVGFAKYLFNVGKEYGDLLRGSITPSAAVAVVANYFGLSKPASLAVGACLVPVTMLVAVCAGFLVVRWRIVHATIEHEWENNPYEKAHIDTLREIRDELRTRAEWTFYPYQPDPPTRAVNVMDLR